MRHTAALLAALLLAACGGSGYEPDAAPSWDTSTAELADEASPAAALDAPSPATRSDEAETPEPSKSSMGDEAETPSPGTRHDEPEVEPSTPAPSDEPEVEVEPSPLPANDEPAADGEACPGGGADCESGYCSAELVCEPAPVAEPILDGSACSSDEACASGYCAPMLQLDPTGHLGVCGEMPVTYWHDCQWRDGACS